GTGGEVHLLVVQEFTRRDDAAVLQFGEIVRRKRRLRRQYDGRRRRPRGALGDQGLLPFQALELPGAEPEQDQHRRDGKEGWPEGRPESHGCNASALLAGLISAI